MSHVPDAVESLHFCPLCDKGEHEYQSEQIERDDRVYIWQYCTCTGCGKQKVTPIPHAEFCDQCKGGNHLLMSESVEILTRHWCECPGCEFVMVYVNPEGPGGTRRSK